MLCNKKNIVVNYRSLELYYLHMIDQIMKLLTLIYVYRWPLELGCVSFMLIWMCAQGACLNAICANAEYGF